MSLSFWKTFVFALIVGALAAAPAIVSAADTAGNPPTTNPSLPTTNPDQPLRFYGPITALDASAKTFTVGDQTFTITDDTKMTKGDGSPATLADAVVGEPARGTYTKADDGKLKVVKVRFGKKTGGKSGGKNGGKKKPSDAPQ